MSIKCDCIYTTPGTDSDFCVNVLWVSRHPPIYAQLIGLEANLGCINVFQLAGTIPSAEFVLEKAKEINAEVIVPVLPLSFIARLSELCRRENITLLWAEMEQRDILPHEPVPGEDYNPDCEVWIRGYEGTFKIMRFVGFRKIKAVKLELEDW